MAYCLNVRTVPMANFLNVGTVRTANLFHDFILHNDIHYILMGLVASAIFIAQVSYRRPGFKPGPLGFLWIS